MESVSRPRALRALCLVPPLRLRACRRVAAMWVVAGAVAGAAPSLAAAPKLQLQSRTAWSVHSERGADGDVIVAARLVDAAGRPLAGAAVRWQAEWLDDRGKVTEAACPVHAATTDAEGQWSWRCAQAKAAQQLEATLRYEGSDAYGGASQRLRIDLALPTPQLTLLTPQKRWLLGDAAWTVRVRATDPQRGGAPLANLELVVQLDGRDQLRVRTGSSGEAAWSLPWSAVGGLGPHTARVATQGSQVNAAELSWQIELATRAGLVATVQAAGEAGACGHDADLTRGDACLTGRVTAWYVDGSRPLREATVTVRVGDRSVGALLSDSDGWFHATLRRAALLPLQHDGQVALTLHAAASEPWIDEGWSEPLVWTVGRASTAAERWGAAVVAALGLVGLGWAWRRRSALRRAQRQQQLAESGLPAAWLQWGPQRSAESRRLRGQVCDGESGLPMAARMTLTAAADGRLLPIDVTDGAFEVDELEPGEWWLSVDADQHMPLRQMLTFPHDGRLDGCVLRPSSCRAVVRDDFSAAVRRATGERMDWGRETPRQAGNRWSRWLRRGHAEVRGATRVVERALYGRHTTAQDVAQVQQSLDSVDKGAR